MTADREIVAAIQREAKKQRAELQRRSLTRFPRLTVRRLFALVVLSAVAFAIWRGLKAVGIAYPTDAVQMTIDMGSEPMEFVAVVAHQDHGDVALGFYAWKVHYFMIPQGAARWDGGPFDSQWIDARAYSILARDVQGTWHLWPIPSEDIQFGWTVSGKTTVSIELRERSGNTPDDAYVKHVVPGELAE